MRAIHFERLVRRMEKTMSGLWITVEAAPGSNIDDVTKQAVALANKLEMTVWFDFNGVKCLARPGDDAMALKHSWERELKASKPFRIASA